MKLRKLRVPLAAGSHTGMGDELIVTPAGRKAGPFPGPWTFAAMTRGRYASEKAWDSRRSDSRARAAAPESTTSSERAKASGRSPATPPT